ncbi:DUF6007 family protein [Staphylococcus warneri]|uniref:DUF6007 family protein n=1 Tax=Staphylococcus warneri TaxID=1292 RepID=UPI000D1D1B7E|nr:MULTISPECIES: DUF6007 family protein [Staphylococcus]PTI04840.1 hypothetical protein BU088_12280 [Staphylococcus warneri]PTI31415.1 hypothetical protein BU078_11975 [Staphylococcus warneri]RIN19278.1 hypothetical protein BU089_10055 [Staphylococcus warneri]
MRKLKNSLLYLAWWDLFFIIPMFLLFIYLPTYNLVSALLNIVIVFFFSMGLILTTHILWNYFKRQD